MPLIDLLQIVLLVVLVVAAAKPVGTFLSPRLLRRADVPPSGLGTGRAVRLPRDRRRPRGRDDVGRLRLVDAHVHVVCVIVLFVLLRLQGVLPLNPAGVPNMPSLLAFNTAVSFVTNTNWQAYSGETGVSYLTQMVGSRLAELHLGGVGIAVAVAFVRGLTRTGRKEIGNFWVDLTRSCLYVLLPLSLVFCAGARLAGRHPELQPADAASRRSRARTQTIAQGPVASQEAIKELGTNGGGFFNANSAHPFENPTPLTNFLEMLAILADPGRAHVHVRACSPATRGRDGCCSRRWSLLFAVGVGAIYGFERAGNPNLTRAGATQVATERQSRRQHGGQGGPVRHRADGALRQRDDRGLVRRRQREPRQPHAACRRDGDAQHRARRDRLRRRGVRTLRHAHLRDPRRVHRRADGRTNAGVPRQEDRADGHEARDARGARARSRASWCSPGSRRSTPAALASILNPGPHGLSEILYAATSAVGNNGSAFGGLNATAPFYTIGLGITMFIGRFLFIVPVLGIAGSMAQQEGRAAVVRHVPDAQARCSSACSSA